MLSSEKNNINELLNDDRFIAWVVSGCKKDNEYWMNVKAGLNVSEQKEFNKAVTILTKLRALHIDDEKTQKSEAFIKGQYNHLMLEYNASKTNKTKVFKLNNWLRYAAVLVVLISITGFIFLFNQSGNTFGAHLVETGYNTSDLLIQTADEKFYKIPDVDNKTWVSENGETITVNNESISFSSPSDYLPSYKDLDYKIFVPKGKKYSVTLVDGTNVELNSNTSISFTNSLSSKERKVEVLGEAFFDVSPNKDRPFVVQSSDLTIEVLGTEFNVSNYEVNQYTSTTLVEGSISVSSQQGEHQVIEPGNQAVLYHNQGHIIVKKVNVQKEVSWTMNRMIFENETLENIVKSLSRWYDVEFVIDDENIRQYKFTGTLKKENEITHFLQMLKYTGGINYEIKGEEIALFFE